MSYDLVLPPAFTDSHPDLELGLTYVSIPGGCINGTEVTFPPNATITALPEQRRLVENPTEGRKIVLLVKVTSKGISSQRYPASVQCSEKTVTARV